jgi:hypothetical protein
MRSGEAGDPFLRKRGGPRSPRRVASSRVTGYLAVGGAPTAPPTMWTTIPTRLYIALSDWRPHPWGAGDALLAATFATCSNRR